MSASPLLIDDAIGVDEAGRGPWAGPVVVAAVLLDPALPIPGLGDSKKLSARRRQALFPVIQDQALAHSIVFIHAQDIDKSDILRATFKGMRQATSNICLPTHLARIDGSLIPPDFPCRAEAVVKGDAKVAAIAAASILAKVARDRYMEGLEVKWPGYGFAQHKGYGTAAHLAALKQLGPCVEHRASFKPIARLMAAMASGQLPRPKGRGLSYLCSRCAGQADILKPFWASGAR